MPALLAFCSHGNNADGRRPGRQLVAAPVPSSRCCCVCWPPSPGKLRFTFIDPIGLGQNVAPFMHLADYDETLVTGKAWTEPQHIEQRLADLTEHMENVIQKYLRNQYPTIEDYNAQAGEVAEPYRVLVVFDFPANFSEAAARRLVSIAQNGPRCGVYTVVLADTAKPLPHGFTLADLEQASTVIAWDGQRLVWQDPDFKDCRLELDAPPDTELFNRIVTAVGAGGQGRQQGGGALRAHRAPPATLVAEPEPGRACACPWGQPARAGCRSWTWAAAPPSTPWWSARPAPASPRCCTR